MAMSAGSVTELGNPSVGLGAFGATFRYDVVLLVVASTTPAVNGVFILPAPLTYDVKFNEPVAPSSISTASLAVSGMSGATVSSATVLSGNTTVQFTLSGISTTGTLAASIAAGAISDAYGNPGAAFAGSYTVATIPPLRLTLPTSTVKGAGTVTGTLTIPAALASPLTVSLTSSDPSRLTVPASLTVPAGQTAVPLPMTVVDDTLLNGLEVVTITAAASGYATGAATIAVHDNETAS